MDATVIIPALDAERLIADQLGALVAQTFEGTWEVIVADNGSTDATASVARSFANRLPGLRVLDASATRGANFARTCGVRAATGRMLLFCDADDRASSTWVERMLLAGQHASFLGGSLDLLELNDARQRSWYGGDLELPGVRPWHGYLSWVTSANFAMTADLAAALGPFDDGYVGAGDDIAISWRATMLGVPPTEVPGAVMHYRLRRSGLPAWKHQYVYGKRMATLYRQFGQFGLPRRSPRTVIASWRHTLVACAASPLLSPDDRRAALRLLAYNSGRLVGSIEERKAFL